LVGDTEETKIKEVNPFYYYQGILVWRRGWSLVNYYLGFFGKGTFLNSFQLGGQVKLGFGGPGG